MSLSEQNRALIQRDLGQSYWEPNDGYVWLAAATEGDLNRLLDAARAEGVAALQQAGESTRRVSLGGEPEKEPVRIDLRDLGFTGYVSAEARSAIDAEARRKMAALINPYAWAFRGLWPDGHGPGPHRTERIAAAEAAARDGNELDKDSSLRAADRVIGALYASPLPQQTALVEEG